MKNNIQWYSIGEQNSNRESSIISLILTKNLRFKTGPREILTLLIFDVF